MTEDLALADYEMLELIGACVASGPLRGRSLVLTGHADNLGTEEYNMALGARRAATVGRYLERFGVPPTELRETSRGELDATGTGPAVGSFRGNGGEKEPVRRRVSAARPLARWAACG